MTSQQDAFTGVYCGFRLNGRPFAVCVRDIKEVHAPLEITPIPGAPPAISGYVNRRGSLHLVIHPHQLLTGEPLATAISGAFIVFRESVGEAFAIHVDRVEGMLHVAEDAIDRSKGTESRSAATRRFEDRVVTGFAKCEDGVWTLVDPRELYACCLQPALETVSGQPLSSLPDSPLHDL